MAPHLLYETCVTQMSEARALEVQRILATALRRDQATGTTLSPRSSLGTLETQVCNQTLQKALSYFCLPKYCGFLALRWLYQHCCNYSTCGVTWSHCKEGFCTAEWPHQMFLCLAQHCHTETACFPFSCCSPTCTTTFCVHQCKVSLPHRQPCSSDKPAFHW